MSMRPSYSATGPAGLALIAAAAVTSVSTSTAACVLLLAAAAAVPGPQTRARLAPRVRGDSFTWPELSWPASALRVAAVEKGLLPSLSLHQKASCSDLSFEASLRPLVPPAPRLITVSQRARGMSIAETGGKRRQSHWRQTHFLGGSATQTQPARGAVA
ncbi:hypothetical protein T492DRAFT_970363 [Pavlovales sp. CCMP2436]|nr:hypothetical protein T492DRAFT_970363 [Pavlovales sp. CCMP2436]